MINLSVDDILRIHAQIQGDCVTGFVFPDGVGSALSSYLYYTDVKMQIISVFYGLVKNHCFSDGNKRTAAAVLILLAQDNNLPILPDDTALEKIVLSAAGTAVSKEQLARQIFGD
jgi:hypothetical protein